MCEIVNVLDIIVKDSFLRPSFGLVCVLIDFHLVFSFLFFESLNIHDCYL